MPPKPSLRMRTWGTRFDTLPTSPSISPPAREAAADEATSPDMPEQTPATEPVLKRKEEKMPHDASVFVGSLPSNIDQQELTRLLSQHLSEHTEVKNIKVVRDSKGGVCAFVQCEDAASAATLIHTLHSNPPKQFLGRTLRYEPARAFRTLLISYRTPMQNIPGNSVEGSSLKLQAVELDLPSAMRVWRPRNSKFYSILYNGDAVDAEDHSRSDPAAAERQSLFLQPVAFDAEAIRLIAAYFGHLENVNPCPLSRGVVDSEVENADDVWKLYPAPHDAPRSSKMDTGCWEIKWEHRDDCVSALMTLRRVPHLTVTWAHQPPPFGFEQRSPYTPFPQNNVAHYPLHVQDHILFMRPRDPSLIDPFGFSRRDGNGVIRPILTSGNASSAPSDNGSRASDTDNEVGAMARTANSVGGQASDTHPVRWSDMDFPPLGNAKRLLKTGTGVWNDRKLSSGPHTRSPSLALSQNSMGAYSVSSDFPGGGHGRKDHGQELEIPPTPGLGRSPLTPKTPGSGFPSTPTTNDGDMQRLSFREAFTDSEGKDHGYYGDFASHEREIDPTTLFVGGLETFGPGAWDEEKVTKFFSRFEGLEDVKIVRPLNSHAAFAFVKFNNTESPARAVFEEHNRVYEGRAMRVQLRDCNPPRGSWRNNRGRGRFSQQSFGPHRRGQDPDKLPDRPSSPGSRRQDGRKQGAVTAQDTAHDEAEAAGEVEPPVYSEAIAPKPSEESTDDVHVPNLSPESRTSSPGTAFTSLNISTSENYREWYDEPLSAALTPPPSSFGSSTSAPASALALPYMAGGYYPPTPWVHPYGQPMQYPMPYLGYPGYAMPGQPQAPQSFPRPPGSDANVAANPGSWPPMGMYGSYIPYQTQAVRTPTIETPPSQQLNNRAPLAPTGFIQNEQGTLIAVYQPEALDQYMAGAHVTPQALPQPQVQSWSQFPQSPAYPFPAPPPTVAMPSRPTLPSATNMAWVQSQGFAPQQQLPTTPHVTQNPHLPGTPGAFRGGYSDTGGQGTSPQAPFRRQAARRDQNNSQNNSGRNNQSRSFPNRNTRGNMNSGGYHGHGDTHANSRNNPFSPNSNEWNQWGGAGR
ncbi:hypothetical protein D9615_001326 [Tricholomella constricta]|uniref:RRM domain-containing protein n=1 Tax=Tricholomella constricta TaxID=117010 RepID=A0A8H5HL87_9AGAR|nr:hypothetical protein D9615_001326 [Tricholomella constricta]